MQKYKNNIGEFTINKEGRFFNIRSYTYLNFHALSNSEIYEEKGLKGCRRNGQILLYPIFDEIAFVENRIYLVCDRRYVILYSQGGYEERHYDSDNHFIFKDGKMGWEKDGRIVVEPKYDEVWPWGYGLYEVEDSPEYVCGTRTYYLNENGEEKLTFRRTVLVEDEQPFSQRTDSNDYLTVIESPPQPELPESNIIEHDGLKIGIDRFNLLRLVKELINSNDDLPLTKEKLRKLTNQFSYEFSAYRFTVKGENPLDKISKLMNNFYVSDNTWYYVMRFTTAPGEQIPVTQVNRFTQYLDNLDHRTLGRTFAFGTDNKLQPGEVSVLLITHYNECCFPPHIQFEFVDVCKKGRLDGLILKDNELKEFTQTEIYDEKQDDFLQDSYDTAFGNISYNPSRSWENTEEVLEYLSTKSDAFKGDVMPTCKQLIACNRKKSSAHEQEYLLGYLKWLVLKGDNVNFIDGGRTSLDLIDRTLENNKTKDVELLREAREILLSAGAKNYTDYKQEFIATNGEYAFALLLLGQQEHIIGKSLTTYEMSENKKES